MGSRIGGQRDEKPKNASLTPFVFYGNTPVVYFYDPQHDRQIEPPSRTLG